MKKNFSSSLASFALAILIVLPVISSVKHLSSNRDISASAAILSGSPLPAPQPPGLSVLNASGSPLPAPQPPGFSELSASGSPLPAPQPPGFSVLVASGSPLPAPQPPGPLA